MVREQIKEVLSQNNMGPFLFVGSGFSRRYLGLESWEGLLRRFCNGIRQFEYYYSTANRSLPRVASLMATDFHEYFWETPEYKSLRDEWLHQLTGDTSALRVAMSDYLRRTSDQALEGRNHEDELELFKTLNVDGFITTNWDCFLEELFPDYKVFIGQRELLSSSPQSIGEIYKVHGCITNPTSLVLTEEDYKEFEDKNPYLAAKLITLFVEHPVIFIGYSLSDPNIGELLRSISLCLEPSQIDRLGKNLIFIQWIESGEDSLTSSVINIEGISIPITLVKLRTFIPLYNALEDTKHKIPARVLRYCKEQLYQLVHSSEPTERLQVADLDMTGDVPGLEFVVGVGLSDGQLAQTGYQAIEARDILHDVLFDGGHFDSNELLRVTMPNLQKRSPYIPIAKYLAREGLDVRVAIGLGLGKICLVDRESFTTPGYRSQFERQFKGISFRSLLTEHPKEKVLHIAPFFDDAEIDIELLGDFLRQHFSYFMKETHNHTTYFRKLVCLYDRLKYGRKEIGFV